MASKNIQGTDVFFLNDTVQLKQSFIFLFALNITSIEVNNEMINLKKTDLLLIENNNQSDILLKAENSILVGSLIVE